MRQVMGVLLVAAAVGCGPQMMTAAQIAEGGTRPYRAQDARHLTRATVQALEAMGFEIVEADAEKGKIVTAPRTVVLKDHAPIAVAWSVDVKDTPDGAVVQAAPRYLRSGAPVKSLDAPYVKEALGELFGEIDENLS